MTSRVLNSFFRSDARIHSPLFQRVLRIKNRISVLFSILIWITSGAKAETLQSLVDQYVSFEQSNSALLKLDPAFEVIRGRIRQGQERDDAFHDLDSGLIKIQKLQADVERYEKGTLGANVLLRRLFELRYEQSSQTVADFLARMSKGLKQDDWKHVAFGTSSDELGRLRSQNSLESQWNLLIAQSSVDRFHLVSGMIKELLLQMKSQSKVLTEENSLWLRCSTTLHPFLRGETIHPGCPEHAFGINCVGEPPRVNELQLCRYYAWKNVYVRLPDFMLGAPREYSPALKRWVPRKVSVPVTYSELMQIPELSLKEKRAYFSADERELYQTPPKLQELSLLEVIPEREGEFLPRELPIRLADTEEETHSSTGDDLLHEDSSGVASSRVELRSQFTAVDLGSSSQEDCLASVPRVLEEEGKHGTEDKAHQVPDENEYFRGSDCVAEGLARVRGQEEEIVREDCSPCFEARLKIETKMSDGLNKEKRPRSVEREGALEKMRLSPPGLRASGRPQPHFPQGIRKFHPAQFHELDADAQEEVQARLVRLKKKEIQWLQQLFNHEKAEFDYRMFHKIWIKMNGPDTILSDGTSHQKLLNIQGRCVGSIFSHGDGHRYFGAYLEYLRAPFMMIGLNQRLLNDL